MDIVCLNILYEDNVIFYLENYYIIDIIKLFF